MFIDTTTVTEFADKQISKNGYNIETRSVSQRSNESDKFIVEYWYDKNNQECHYGYYIIIEDNRCKIIEEGEQVDKNLFSN